MKVVFTIFLVILFYFPATSFPETESPVNSATSAIGGNQYTTEIDRKGEFVLGTSKRDLASIYFASMNDKTLQGSCKIIAGGRERSDDPFEERRLDEKYNQYCQKVASKIRSLTNGMYPDDLELEALVLLKKYDFKKNILVMNVCNFDGGNLNCTNGDYTLKLAHAVRNNIKSFIFQNNLQNDLPNLTLDIDCKGKSLCNESPTTTFFVTVELGEYKVAIKNIVSDKAESLYQIGYGHKYNYSKVSYYGYSETGTQKRSILFVRAKLDKPKVFQQVYGDSTKVDLTYKVKNICLYDTNDKNGAPLYCGDPYI